MQSRRKKSRDHGLAHHVQVSCRGVFTDFYGESGAMLQSVTGWDVTADEMR